MEPKNAVAIVTGGIGGLGSCICHALAQQGTHIAVVYAQTHDTAETVTQALRALGVKAIPVQCDVAQPDQVQRLVSQVHDAFGRVDILVNDAAYNNKWIPFPDVDGLTLEEWTKILTVNLTGPMLCIKAVAPIM